MLEIPKSQFSLGAEKAKEEKEKTLAQAQKAAVAPSSGPVNPPPASPAPPAPTPSSPMQISPIAPAPAEGAAQTQAQPKKPKDPEHFKKELAAAKEKAVYGVGCFYELTKWLIFVVILVALIHFFVATIFIVDGQSMEPNFHTGEMLIANRWQYLFGQPQRSDVAVLKFPGDPEHAKYIKRIIGLPGENIIIQNGYVYINGQKLNEPYLAEGTLTEPNLNRTLGPGEYFLMGDNRINSSDSRIWGVADKHYLIGKAWFIFWPKENIGKIKYK